MNKKIFLVGTLLFVSSKMFANGERTASAKKLAAALQEKFTHFKKNAQEKLAGLKNNPVVKELGAVYTDKGALVVGSVLGGARVYSMTKNPTKAGKVKTISNKFAAFAATTLAVTSAVHYIQKGGFYLYNKAQNLNRNSITDALHSNDGDNNQQS